MSTSHLCKNHPKGKRWLDGPVKGCPYHNHNRPAPRVRMKDGGRADREAGVVGRQGEGYIHGGNDVGDFTRPARQIERRKRYL